MLKQILNTFITRILSGILNLLIAIIISKYLGAEGKGVQGIILTTISILVIFSGIVGPGGLTYLLPRMNFKVLIIPSYLWSFIIAASMWKILLIFQIIPKEYVIHVVFIILLASFTGINNSILYSGKRIQQVNLVSIIQIVVTLLVISYLIILKKYFSVHSYIIGLYFGFITSVIVSYILTWKKYQSSTENIPISKYIIGFKNLFRYGGYNQLDIFAQLLSFRLAYYILNYFTTTSQVGIYSNAVSLIEAIWIISRSISYVQHSRIVNSRDKNYSSNLTLQFMKLTGFLAFCSITLLVLIPSDLYKYVFGAEFGDIRIVIISLSPGVFFFSISFIISSYFSGVGKHYVNSISSIVGLVITVILTLIMIPKYGIIGAGISASVSYFFTTLVKMHYFIKTTKIKMIRLLPTKGDFKDVMQLSKLLKEEN